MRAPYIIIRRIVVVEKGSSASVTVWRMRKWSVALSLPNFSAHAIVNRLVLICLYEKCLLIFLIFNSQRGYIDRQEFSELCANFQIQKEDAGTIFEDLDRDQDERIRYLISQFIKRA